MSDRNTVVRALHDVGLAAWFGGWLMGVVGLNGAAEEEGGNLRTAQIASRGWTRWTPLNAAAIGVRLLNGAGVLLVNRGRVVGQRGVGASTLTKGLLAVAALGFTGYSRVLGKKIELASSPDPVDAEKAEEDLGVLGCVSGAGEQNEHQIDESQGHSGRSCRAGPGRGC